MSFQAVAEKPLADIRGAALVAKNIAQRAHILHYRAAVVIARVGAAAENTGYARLVDQQPAGCAEKVALDGDRSLELRDKRRLDNLLLFRTRTAGSIEWIRSQRRLKNASGSSRRMLWLMSRRVWKNGFKPFVKACSTTVAPSTNAHSVRDALLSAIIFISLLGLVLGFVQMAVSCKRYQILRLHIDDSLTKCSPLLHIYTTNLA